MKLEYIKKELISLKTELYHKRVVLKNYCERKNLSYTSTSRILKKGIDSMNLRTAYNILGLTPERNLSAVILDLNFKQLENIKKAFIDELI